MKMKNNENLTILECCHFYHKDWFKSICKKQYMDKQQVYSTWWKDHIPNTMINMLYGQGFIEYLNDELLRIQILSESNMVQCTCKNYIELVPGSVDYKQKDNEGKVITKQAAEHMANYRVRCNNCDRIFWSKCNMDPYHIGQTCEEFEEYKGADKWRFCLDKLNKIRKKCKPAFKAVCSKEEWEELMEKSCSRQLEWGHFWCGTREDQMWLPCLEPDWVEANPGMTLKQNGDDYWTIWYAGGLSQAPCVQLDWKHIFHEEWLVTVLKNKWSGPRINFEFIKCPSCKTTMSCFNNSLMDLINDALKLESKINEMALQRGKHEGIDKDDRLKDPPYNGDLASYSVARLSYYMWFKCKKPYFGGLKSCENNQNQNIEKFKPEELVWAACSADSAGGGIKDWKKHGRDFIEFKCKFCCKVAQWFCWGTTHFCDDCHTRQNKGDYLTKKKLSELPKCKNKYSCPLKVDHPPNGKEEYALGCAICRNLAAQRKDF